MKLMMTLISGLMLFTTTAYCQLTDADLNKIRLVVKEEIETSEKRMKEYVDTTEKRMKEHISQEIASEIRPVNTTIVEMDKRLNQIFALVITLVAFIAVVVGVPQIIVAMQRKDIRSQDEKIESQQNQIENLLNEIETLKQGRIVSP